MPKALSKIHGPIKYLDSILLTRETILIDATNELGIEPNNIRLTILDSYVCGTVIKMCDMCVHLKGLGEVAE